MVRMWHQTQGRVYETPAIERVAGRPVHRIAQGAWHSRPNGHIDIGLPPLYLNRGHVVVFEPDPRMWVVVETYNDLGAYEPHFEVAVAAFA